MQESNDAPWPKLPIEFFVVGIPVSLQGSTKSRSEWVARVRAAAVAAVPTGSWALNETRLSVSIVYFPAEPLPGDVDNRIKLILDGLRPNVLLDDELVDRVLAHRIHPDADVDFAAPTPTLAAALASPQSTVYVRIDGIELEGIRL